MIRFRLETGVEPFQDMVFGWSHHEVAQVRSILMSLLSARYSHYRVAHHFRYQDHQISVIKEAGGLIYMYFDRLNKFYVCIYMYIFFPINNYCFLMTLNIKSRCRCRLSSTHLQRPNISPLACTWQFGGKRAFKKQKTPDSEWAISFMNSWG